MQRAFVFLALGIFAFDLVADSVCIDDQSSVTSGPCCVCARDTHMTATSGPLIVSEAQPAGFAPYTPPFYAYQQPASIFHPPCPAA